MLGKPVIQPIYQAIPYQDPAVIFERFADETGAVWLDSSSTTHGDWGRYSYIGFSPFSLFIAKNQHINVDGASYLANPFDHLENILQHYTLLTIPELPPFQGGIIGYFSYELNQHLESIKINAVDDQQFPDMALGFYDVVIAFDLPQKKCWVISSGLPEIDKKTRELNAKQRLKFVMQCIEKPRSKNRAVWPFLDENLIFSNFDTRSAYETAVQKVIDYIYAGDIFQANLTQRFLVTLPDKNADIFALYTALRRINPAPFAAYLNFGSYKLAAASPERFLKLTNDRVETCPIKGTRKRGNTPAEDQILSNELMSSKKDHAENTMIVDLLRNDLSRVAQNHSVKVNELCALYSFASVHHLVSTVSAQLKNGLHAIDLLRATFPGGSITGAPKIRAMEIIDELEPTTRGPYCGALGFIGFDGNMDLAITIRSFCINQQKISFQVGGAIVADSCPAKEYEETLTKASALFRALCGALPAALYKQEVSV